MNATSVLPVGAMNGEPLGFCRCCRKPGNPNEINHELVCLGCEDRWEEACQEAAQMRRDYARAKGRD